MCHIMCVTNMLHNTEGLNKNYMWDVIGAEHQVSQAIIDLFLNQENMCEELLTWLEFGL